MPVTHCRRRSLTTRSPMLRGVITLFLIGACQELPSAVGRDADVRSVHILGEGLQLRAGESQRLVAEAVDGAGRPLGVLIRWHSDDVSVATVDSVGLVTATGVGATAIHATVGRIDAQISARTRPAALDLVVPDLDNAEVGMVLDFRAVYRDVSGREVMIGRGTPVAWHISVASATLEFPDPADSAYVRVRMLERGPVRLEVFATGLSAMRSWTVLPESDAPAATIQRFVLRQGQAGIGWLYVPDLFVRGTRVGVTVTRIEFRTNSWTMAACGRAALQVGTEEPLFDFQPYNFSWVGTPVAHGTPVQLTMWLERNGRSVAIHAVGVVESADVRIVYDYGTSGFPWSTC